MVAGADRPLSKVEVRATCSPLRVNKAVLTDGNGRYEITELPQGTDPEFLERVRSKATSVTIMDGETKTMDLRVQTSEGRFQND